MESGEGIESRTSASPPRGLSSPVESGEGIERGRRLSHNQFRLTWSVESGEGIESSISAVFPIRVF